MKLKLAKLGTALAATLLLSVSAKAVSFGFEKITSNSPDDVSSQLLLEVTDTGLGVAFTFTNAVGLQSSITDVYFQAMGFSAPFDIASSGGVAFSAPATPGSLPGQNDAGFVTTLGLSADSDPPPVANGVNTSTEWLTITFDYGDYLNFAGVISAINSQDLRIGLHVQSHPTDGDSEGYVNTVPVPDGGVTVILLGLGLASVAGFRRFSHC